MARQDLRFLRDIDSQIEDLTDAGLRPAYIVLSHDRYMLLMAHLAANNGREQLEGLSEYRDCGLVVVPTPDYTEVTVDAADAWEQGEEWLVAKGLAKPRPFPTERAPSESQDSSWEIV